MRRNRFEMIKGVAFLTFFLFVLVPLWMAIGKFHDLRATRED